VSNGKELIRSYLEAVPQSCDQDRWRVLWGGRVCCLAGGRLSSLALQSPHSPGAGVVAPDPIPWAVLEQGLCSFQQVFQHAHLGLQNRVSGLLDQLWESVSLTWGRLGFEIHPNHIVRAPDDVLVVVKLLPILHPKELGFRLKPCGKLCP